MTDPTVTRPEPPEGEAEQVVRTLREILGDVHPNTTIKLQTVGLDIVRAALTREADRRREAEASAARMTEALLALGDRERVRAEQAEAEVARLRAAIKVRIEYAQRYEPNYNSQKDMLALALAAPSPRATEAE